MTQEQLRMGQQLNAQIHNIEKHLYFVKSIKNNPEKGPDGLPINYEMSLFINWLDLEDYCNKADQAVADLKSQLEQL